MYAVFVLFCDFGKKSNSYLFDFAFLPFAKFSSVTLDIESRHLTASKVWY